MIGLDVGFGWTKVVAGKGGFKFPSWLAYYKPSAMSDIEPVTVDGRDYVVGEDARAMKKIDINDVPTLVKYLPVFVKYVKTLTGSEGPVVTGLPPKYYKSLKDEVLKTADLVVPQSVGILVDVEDSINAEPGEWVVVIDIGFNTLDYLVAEQKGDRWSKKAVDSIDNFGVSLAVDHFKKYLPSEVVGIVKNWSLSKVMKIFEEGRLKIAGEVIDLSPYKKRAVEEYVEQLFQRLKEELGDLLLEADHFVVGGGGANIIPAKEIRKDAFIPEDPEFSNARGYFKIASQLKK
jgi:hypothetical protein